MAFLLHYLIFYIGPFLSWLIVTCLLLMPMRMGRWRLLASSALVAAMLARGLWFQLLGGNMYYPAIPAFACNALGWGYSMALILSVLALLPPYRWWRVRGTVFILVAAALAAWGSYESLRVPVVNRYEVSVPGLPASFDGMKIVQVSDLHCSPSLRRPFIQGVVDRVNACKADLVCITGDIVDGSPDTRLDDLRPLADIKARWGVLGCSGNHEFYSGYERWLPHFLQLGVRMLDNAHVVITNGTDRIAVGGILDKASIGRGFWMGPDVARAFKGAPDCLRILLSHRPTGLAESALHGVRLQLSGHTHGAAVAWLANALVASMNDGHIRGFYHEHGVTLYVTPGAGQWAGLPLRLGVSSEIAELTLRAAKDGSQGVRKGDAK